MMQKSGASTADTFNNVTLNACMSSGDACAEKKLYQHALLHFTKAILLAPTHVLALMKCAQMLLALNRPTEAAVYTERALTLNSNPQTNTIHGQALYQMGHYTEALACFTANSNSPSTMGQRAMCLTQLNRYDEAAELYQLSLSQEPKDPVIQANYALCLLAQGNLLDGFKAFEWRWQSQLKERSKSWVLPADVNKSVLQNKSILIRTEQGFGDSLQFFRYIPLLAQYGARITLEIQPALIPLLSSWKNKVTFIASGSPLPVCDYHVSMMSLAFIFKTDLQSIPRTIPYVFSDPLRVESCRLLLKPSTHKRIGIAWKGSTLNKLNHKRSIALSTLLKIHRPDVDFICLQNDITHDEKDILDQHFILYCGLELNTFEGTAALISCLDLVITIDTAIAHLAGAMGKPVWIILPFSADWRWLLNREDSPWYPTATLFRQNKMDDWHYPLAQIGIALNTLIANAPPSVNMAHMTIDQSMRLAVQLQGDGQLSQAETILNSILATHPTHAHALHLLGIIANQNGNTLLGIQLIQKAITSDATIALFHSNLGEMHRQLNAIDLSIACGLRALNLNPHSPHVLSNLGLAYYDAKNYEQAEAYHQRALALNPEQSYSLNNMGSINKERNNIEEAIQYYRAAIASSPSYVEPINNLGAVLISEQQFNQAIELLKRAIKLAPDYADAYCNLGFALYGLNNDDKALAYFQQALQLKPNYAEAYIGLSKIYLAKFELESAKSCVLKAIEIDPNKAEFYNCLAEIYGEQGDTKQAIAYSDHALSIDSKCL